MNRFHLEKAWSALFEIQRKNERYFLAWLVLVASTVVLLHGAGSAADVHVPLIQIPVGRLVAAEMTFLLACVISYAMASVELWERVLRHRLRALHVACFGSASPLAASEYPGVLSGIFAAFHAIGLPIRGARRAGCIDAVIAVLFVVAFLALFVDLVVQGWGAAHSILTVCIDVLLMAGTSVKSTFARALSPEQAAGIFERFTR
jgi:hypothetical protein